MGNRQIFWIIFLSRTGCHMINSINGFGGYNSYKPRSICSKGNTIFSYLMENQFGITNDQKEQLKQKYGASHLDLTGDKTKQLMEELKKLGVITGDDVEAYARPEWVDDDKTVRIMPINSADIYSDSIQKTFRLLSDLQLKEAAKVSGEERSQFFKDRSVMYEKLANIMDYIFA